MKTFVAHKAQVKVCDTSNELGDICAKEFLRIVNESIVDHGHCSVALSGGSTPKLMYDQLVKKENIKAADWSKVHFFVSDERCVELEDKNSNFGNAQREFMDQLNLPEENLHPAVDCHTGSPPEAAAKYEEVMKEFFQLAEGQFPRFDLMLLGMGPDGHCASLFPNTPALKENKRIVVSNRVPAAISPNRITMTFPAINSARNIIFIIQGAEKSHVLGEVLAGDAVSYPVHQIFPTHGRMEWIIDRTAAEDFLKTEAGSR